MHLKVLITLYGLQGSEPPFMGYLQLTYQKDADSAEL